jgi:predicted ATP-dependent serine protease
VTGIEARVKEAAALGFTRRCAQEQRRRRRQAALPVHGVATIHEAIDALLG